MGGCRCTYRNCSSAADGKTHLFHYPVFDKVRCLKWLTNAGKLEFLDLKLSQLKNRVICQHHFKDECFMNYKKDRLTFEAVPTEDGSFTDSTVIKYDEKINLPITLEDIDNSETRALTAREKKANFSVKYGEFLTDPIIHSADNIPEFDADRKVRKKEKDNNCISFEMWSHKTPISINTRETPPISLSQPFCNSDYVNKRISFNVTENVEKEKNIFNVSENLNKGISFNVSENVDKGYSVNVTKNVDKGLSFNVTENYDKEMLFNVSENVGKEASFNAAENVHKGFFLNVTKNEDKASSFNIDLAPTPEILNIREPTPNIYDNLNNKKLLPDFVISSSQIKPNDNTNEARPENKTINKNKNRIKIISEKTLTGPLPLVGTFEPVYPKVILNPCKRKIETELPNKEISFILTVKEEPQVPKQQTSVHSIEHITSPANTNLLPNEAQNELKTICTLVQNQSGNRLSNSRSPSARNKIPPERVAAIEEKRSFNKKLRDMIEFCLEDKDEITKMPMEVKSPQTSQIEYEYKNSQLIKNTTLNKQSENCTESVSVQAKKGENEKNLKSTVNKNEVIKSPQDYKLTVLEAKLSRMENLLLKKVGENTRRIDSLKQMLSKSTDVKKGSIQTQTMQDKEMHKKELFSEISRYLSPELNSLIYEELFMKEFEPKIPYSKTRRHYNEGGRKNPICNGCSFIDSLLQPGVLPQNAAAANAVKNFIQDL